MYKQGMADWYNGGIFRQFTSVVLSAKSEVKYIKSKHNLFIIQNQLHVSANIQGGPKVGIQYTIYYILFTVYLLLGHLVYSYHQADYKNKTMYV